MCVCVCVCVCVRENIIRRGKKMSSSSSKDADTKIDMIPMNDAITKVIEITKETITMDTNNNNNNTNNTNNNKHKRVPIERAVNEIAFDDYRAVRGLPMKDCAVMDGYCFNVKDDRKGDGVEIKEDCLIIDDEDDEKCDDDTHDIRKRVTANGDLVFKVNKLLLNRAQYKENENNECAQLGQYETAYVTTGAVLPNRANVVVPFESCSVPFTIASDPSKDEYISVTKDTIIDNMMNNNKWIRKKESDVKTNDLLLKKGTKIEWFDVGILASGGISEIDVYRKPKFAIACTGDEIVERSREEIPLSNRAASYDVNGPALRTALRFNGAEIINLFPTTTTTTTTTANALDDDDDESGTKIIRDEELAVRDMIKRALESDCDVLITTGGASKGDRDYIYQAMMTINDDFGIAECATRCHFRSLSMKPGKPTKFFSISRKKLFPQNNNNNNNKLDDLLCLALPGNPVSCCVTYELLVKPILRVLQGQNVVSPARIVAKLGEDIKLDCEREEFHRVSLRWESSTEEREQLVPLAFSTGRQISSRILSMQSADALVELPVGHINKTKLLKGTLVSVVPLADLRQRGMATVRDRIEQHSVHDDGNAKASPILSSSKIEIKVINDENTVNSSKHLWVDTFESHPPPAVVAILGLKANALLPEQFKRLQREDSIPGVEEIVREFLPSPMFDTVSAFRVFSLVDERVTLVVCAENANDIQSQEMVKHGIIEAIRGDETLLESEERRQSKTDDDGIVRRITYARIGLLGNPSDQYFGEVIAVSIKNFFAETILTPFSSSSEIKIIPGEYDTNDYNSLSQLKKFTSEHGYEGGAKLLKSLLANFAKFCEDKNIELKNPNAGFSLSYSSNIPKQTGMSGSSAIIISALNCLLDRYDVRGKISKEERAFLALQVESDIGIAAGLMDRVIQVYGGCVHMNFRNVEKVKETGIGEYTYVDCDKIPKLFIVWSQNPSNSGKIHQPVRQKWLNGDSEIIQGMKTAADCAREGLQIMEMSSGKESCAIRLAPILSANFAARRKMFTDAGLGDENIRMIEVCQSVGAGAKFTGSGGAIVACCPDGIEQEMRLQTAVEEAGFSFAEVEINSTREE